MKTAQLLIASLATAWMTGAHALPITSDADEIQMIKQQIIDIANKSTATYDGDDNDPAIRAELDPLVAQLVALAGDRTQDQLLAQAIGSWHQLWSDVPAAAGTGALRTGIYTIFDKDGYVWHVTKEDNAGVQTTGLMRADYTLADDGLTLKFTKDLSKPDWFTLGGKVSDLAAQAELGAYDAFPRDNKDGMSPVGKSTMLQLVYVDDDLSISKFGGLDMAGSFLCIDERTDDFK